MDTRQSNVFLFKTGNTHFGQIWLKNKNSLSWNLGLDYFKYAKFNGDVYFLNFRPETPFLANLVQKIKHFQFKLKFGT